MSERERAGGGREGGRVRAKSQGKSYKKVAVYQSLYNYDHYSQLHLLDLNHLTAMPQLTQGMEGTLDLICTVAPTPLHQVDGSHTQMAVQALAIIGMLMSADTLEVIHMLDAIGFITTLVIIIISL